MAIGAIGTSAAASLTKTERTVEAQRTPVTQDDLRGALNRAYTKLNGKAPTAALLDTLTAHASLETGSGGQMYNYNFGGIKGAGPAGTTAVCRTKEVLNGKEVEVRDGFRAYKSLDEGATDYVRLMQSKFSGAVSRAQTGDVSGFAHELKQAHYYTADETKYASALEALSKPGSGSTGSAAKSAASTTSAMSNTNLGLDQGGSSWGYPPSTVELGRVLDAIARHPTTVDDPDEDS